MEELLQHHRKQQRDLQSQVTQKKKSASKKTRKSINDECERLERELKRKQAEELATYRNGADIDEEQAERISISSRGIDPDDPEDIPDRTVKSDQSRTLSLSHLGISDPVEESATQKTPQQRKPNRQKARLARRAAEQDATRVQAAEEAANMPDLKTLERTKLLTEAKQRGLTEKEMAANGHCLYLAVADQMLQQKLSLETPRELSGALGSSDTRQNDLPDYKKVRVAAADYIASHPQDFEPFLEESMDTYLHKLRDTGEWGGELELAALSKAYQIDINVLQASGRLEKIESGIEKEPHEVWLAYYRHGFGLGEHYNSLRKIA